MQTIRPALTAIGAIVPVIYWGWLAIHFFNVGGSIEGVQEIGLGPTVLGTGIVSLLFAIPLLLRIPRLFRGSRTPGSGRDDDDDGDGGFDADAAIARYMAQRSVEPARDPSPRPPTDKGGRPAGRPSFGRRS